MGYMADDTTTVADLLVRWNEAWEGRRPQIVTTYAPPEAILSIPALQPDLWPLIDQWLEWADRDIDPGSASAYRHCAEMLIEIAGPRCVA